MSSLRFRFASEGTEGAVARPEGTPRHAAASTRMGVPSSGCFPVQVARASANAGGTAVLRYGNARDMVLGLEVVLVLTLLGLPEDQRHVGTVYAEEAFAVPEGNPNGLSDFQSVVDNPDITIAILSGAGDGWRRRTPSASPSFAPLHSRGLAGERAGGWGTGVPHGGGAW